MPTRREIARLQYALEASYAGDGVGNKDVGSASPKLPEGAGNEAAGTKRTSDSIPSERPQKRRREEMTKSMPQSTRLDQTSPHKTGGLPDMASSQSPVASSRAVDKDISSDPVSKTTKVVPVSETSPDEGSSQKDVPGSSSGSLKEAQEAAPVPSMYDEYFLRSLESGIDIIFNHVKSVKGVDLERVLGTEQGPSSVSSLIPGWSSLRVYALPSGSDAGDTSPSALLDGAKFDAMARVFERKAAGRFGRKPGAAGGAGPGAERASSGAPPSGPKSASPPAAGGAVDGSSESPAGGLAFLPRTTASSAWWGITEGTEAPASSRTWASQSASSGGSSTGGTRGGASSAASSSAPSSSPFYPSSRRSGSGASGGAGAGAGAGVGVGVGVSGRSSGPSSSSSSAVSSSSGRGGGGPGREHDWGARGSAGGGRRGDRSGNRGSGTGRDRGRDRALAGGSGRRGAGSGSGSGSRMQVQVQGMQVQGGMR